MQNPYFQLAAAQYPYYDGTYTQQMMPYQVMPQQVAPQQVVPMQPSGSYIPGTPQAPGVPFVEESYVENILRANLGKVATIYMTFENNTQWNAKIFRGALEAAGRDHIIISDPQTGRRYLLLTVNLDYITFDEELNYISPPLPPGVTR
jgi:spore germination protein Q